MKQLDLLVRSGPVFVSWPGHDGWCESDDGEEDLWASVVAARDPPLVFKSPEHDLYPVAAFVAALVVFHGLAVRLPAWDAGLYSLVFQRLSKPVGITTAVSQQTTCFRQAAEESDGPGVAAVSGLRS